MNVVAVICFVFLCIGALFTTVRLVLGPSLADRVVASDMLLTFLALAIGVQAARTGDGLYLGVMVVIALVGFLGTALVARLIERRGG